MTIIDEEYEEVYFHDYCPKCKYLKVDDTKGKEPCNECLDNPVNLYSHKPVNFEAK